MPKYHIFFAFPHGWAEQYIKADTPEAALLAAQRVNPKDLSVHLFSMHWNSVEITVDAEDREHAPILASWISPDEQRSRTAWKTFNSLRDAIYCVKHDKPLKAYRHFMEAVRSAAGA